MRLIEQNTDVELVLLDLSLPDRDGFDALAEIGERYPTISVVVLSDHQDRDLGALGFIAKSTARDVMLSAFNLIFSGGIHIPPQMLDRSGQVTQKPVSVPPKRQVSAEISA